MFAIAGFFMLIDTGSRILFVKITHHTNPRSNEEKTAVIITF